MTAVEAKRVAARTIENSLVYKEIMEKISHAASTGDRNIELRGYFGDAVRWVLEEKGFNVNYNRYTLTTSIIW